MKFKEIIPYALYKDDNKGCRHSIDKLIINYWFHDDFDFHDFCLSFSSSSSFIFHGREDEGYNSYFDRKPSSSYAWYANAFWFPHCNVKYGLYRRKKEFIGPTEIITWQLEKVMKIEFNPNKIYQNDLFILLQCLIHRYAKVGILEECDYAVDLPCKTDKIISQSRKDKVVYNDSRYYGKRHTNGRLKIYNKRKEVKDKEKVDITEEVTRCELTCKNNEELQLDSVYCCNTCNADVNLSSNLNSISCLILLAASYGEDKEELLRRYVPDKRNRDKLIPILFGVEDKIFELSIFLDLLSNYCGLYEFTSQFKNISVNKRGFQICNT